MLLSRLSEEKLGELWDCLNMGCGRLSKLGLAALFQDWARPRLSAGRDELRGCRCSRNALAGLPCCSELLGLSRLLAIRLSNVALARYGYATLTRLRVNEVLLQPLSFSLGCLLRRLSPLWRAWIESSFTVLL